MLNFLAEDWLTLEPLVPEVIYFDNDELVIMTRVPGIFHVACEAIRWCVFMILSLEQVTILWAFVVLVIRNEPPSQLADFVLEVVGSQGLGRESREGKVKVVGKLGEGEFRRFGEGIPDPLKVSCKLVLKDCEGGDAEVVANHEVCGGSC